MGKAAAGGVDYAPVDTRKSRHRWIHNAGTRILGNFCGYRCSKVCIVDSACMAQNCLTDDGASWMRFACIPKLFCKRSSSIQL